MPDFTPPPPRKKWEAPPGYSTKVEYIAEQKMFEKERKDLSKKEIKLSQLLGKLNKSGNTSITTGPYAGNEYDYLFNKHQQVKNEIKYIDGKLKPSRLKYLRNKYKKTRFSNFRWIRETKIKVKEDTIEKENIRYNVDNDLSQRIKYFHNKTQYSDDEDDEDEREGSGAVAPRSDGESLIKRLELICGRIIAGNTSFQLEKMKNKYYIIY